MNPEDKIRELIRKSDVTTNPETDKRTVGDALEHLGWLKQQASAEKWPGIGRTIVGSPVAGLAAAAVIVVVCAISLSVWRTTGTGIALADVLARVEQIKVFRCKGTFKMTGYATDSSPYQWEVHYTYLKSQEYGTKVRCEVQDPNSGKRLLGETYSLPLKKMEIDHAQKKYTRMDYDDATDRREEKGASRCGDPRAFLNEIVNCKHESLGRSTIDGAEVEGFRTTDPNCRGSGFGYKDPQVDVKLWVNVKTHLPVRYESLKSGLDEMGNRMSHHWVMHDFQWDVPVDVSEFEPPVPPDDYIVLVEKPLGPINEETVIQALSQCVELLGNYPESLSVALNRAPQLELDKSNSPAATRLKEEFKELTEVKKAQRLADASMPMRLLFEFYVGLIEDRKDPEYYGKSVTPKDADKVLMRWKLSDNECRVIFGDLHTETITREKLAELSKLSLQ